MPTAAVRSLDSINRVVQAFCSEGVPYKSVSEIAKICRGQVMSKDFLRDNAGEYPVYSSQTENDGMLGKITTYMFDGEYLTWTTDGANAGTVFYRKGKFSVTNVCGVIDVTDETISTKYLFYVLNREAPQYVNKGMGNPKLMSNVMAKIRIPLPPLPVQQEIVRILDSFTELTTELNKKLTAELTARRKQYEHYRDELLTFGDDVLKIPLCKLFNTRNGYTPSKTESEFWSNGTVPWFRMEDIRENGRILDHAIQSVSSKAVKGKPFPANSIIVATSATIGEHALLTVESLANQRFTYLMVKDEYKEKVNIKYLFYYCFLLDKYCLSCLNQGNFASVDMTKFNKFLFAVPSIEDQNHIVTQLDRFNALCNDLTSGLPAEIAARQKQYEYYRDKLLTFKERETN